MPGIYIITPDAALSEAVSEGLKLAKLGDVRADADMAAALNGDEVSAIILDEAAADKKSLKAFQNAGEKKKKRVFLLGETDASWTENIAVESFAKPLRLGHLLSRLAFYLGSQQRAKSGAVIFGGWRFEAQNRQVTRGEGTPVRLTEKETALLDYLAQSDAPVAREELLAAVWGHDGRIDTHTLETHVYQLRRKLDPDGHLLVNENGRYFLAPRGVS